MIGMPSFFARGATGTKAGNTPGGGPVSHQARPNGSQAPGHKPGQDSPEDLAGNAAPENMSKNDRFQTFSNVAFAGSSILPMIPGLGGGEKNKQPPPGSQENGGQPIEDKTEYNQNKIRTAVGGTPVNW